MENANIYTITTEKNSVCLETVHTFLSEESYWAKGCARETVARAIENSLCFSLLDGDRFVGFARAITDYATFAYLSDFFIVASYRGKGLGKMLVSHIVQYPDLQDLRSFLLATSDAHGLYENYGSFNRVEGSDFYMKRAP